MKILLFDPLIVNFIWINYFIIIRTNRTALYSNIHAYDISKSRLIRYSALTFLNKTFICSQCNRNHNSKSRQAVALWQLFIDIPTAWVALPSLPVAEIAVPRLHPVQKICDKSLKVWNSFFVLYQNQLRYIKNYNVFNN